MNYVHHFSDTCIFVFCFSESNLFVATIRLDIFMRLILLVPLHCVHKTDKHLCVFIILKGIK